ncbi:MAG: hypothetical protein AAB916_00995 [Patescibacteria group bacterium]
MAMMKKLRKRKYEKKLFQRVIGIRGNRDVLLAHLKKEWEEIEKEVARDQRKRKRYDTAQQAGITLGFTLLGIAALCGVVFVSAVAPNVLSAFGRLGRHRRYFRKKDFMAQLYAFRQRGYVEAVKDDEGCMEIRLTEMGKIQVVKRALGDLRIAPQEQWDGIWRVVLFDIPERNKWAREGMRQSLKRMGFYPLQKSTFVFPYPCREEVAFLRNLYDIGHSVRFIETNLLDTDSDAKDFFSLS